MLPVTLSIHTRVTGLEPILQESKSCVLTSCTTPYYISRKGEELAYDRQSSGLLVANSGRAMLEPDRSEARPRTHDRLLIRQEFLPAELPSYIVGRIGFEPIPRGASIHRSTIGAIFPRKNHLPLSDKWSNSAKHSITAYTAHNPHNLIKTRQIIQFLILHQN